MKRIEKIFIGIDFAQEKFDARYLDEDGVTDCAVFRNVKSEYVRMISWIKKTAGIKGKLDPSEILFCGEHTGECSLPLSEWLVSRGYRIWLDNAVRIKRSAGIVRGKSDKADACMIAQYAMEKYKPGETILFTPDLAVVKELKSLFFCRMEIVKQRVGLHNRIVSGSFDHSSVALKALKKTYNELVKQEKNLEAEIENVMSSSSELASNYRILKSFKGIGVMTAAMFIVYTNNFTRFTSPRRFACHIGVAPFGKDSGSSVHIDPHVSNFAHKKAKAFMVQAVKSAIMHNPAIREYAEKLKKRGKHHGVIMNNVKNKIIHIIFKMIETRKEWEADYQESHMSGKQSRRSLGVPEKKGAAEATPAADTSVQTSPSVFGGTQIYEKKQKNSKMPKKTCGKICTES